MSLKKLLYIIMVYLTAGVWYCEAADCDIAVSQSTINYQRITTDDFASSHGLWNTLDPREIIVSTQCSDPVQIENVFSSISMGKKFMFGGHSLIAVVASDAYLDGNPVSLGKDSTPGAFTPTSGGHSLIPVLAGNTIIPLINGKVPMGQRFIFRLTIKPIINAADLHAKDQDEIETNINAKVIAQ